jgi:hypothetical protein
VADVIGQARVEGEIAGMRGLALLLIRPSGAGGCSSGDHAVVPPPTLGAVDSVGDEAEVSDIDGKRVIIRAAIHNLSSNAKRHK